MHKVRRERACALYAVCLKGGKGLHRSHPVKRLEKLLVGGLGRLEDAIRRGAVDPVVDVEPPAAHHILPGMRNASGNSVRGLTLEAM